MIGNRYHVIIVPPHCGLNRGLICRTSSNRLYSDTEMATWTLRLTGTATVKDSAAEHRITGWETVSSTVWPRNRIPLILWELSWKTGPRPLSRSTPNTATLRSSLKTTSSRYPFPTTPEMPVSNYQRIQYNSIIMTCIFISKSKLLKPWRNSRFQS